MVKTKIDDEKSFEFFLKNGILATMRNYHYRVGGIVGIKQNSVIVTYGKILAVLENNETFQRILLKYSSFNDIHEWKKRAKELHGKLPRYIVIVKRIRLNQAERYKDQNIAFLNSERKANGNEII